MIRNDEIQSNLITKLKGNANIIAKVPAVEIREDQWQGTTFTYPNIRIKLVNDYPGNLCQQSFIVNFLVYTEDSYSDNADEIAGIIATELDDKPYIADGLQISLSSTEIVPATRVDSRTWLAEARFRGTVCRVV